MEWGCVINSTGNLCSSEVQGKEYRHGILGGGANKDLEIVT